MKDLELKTAGILGLIISESDRQIKKWGIQDRHPFEWLAYTTEELGELSKAISENHYRDGLASKVIGEAVQVATLALKIAEMFINEPIRVPETL